MDQLQKNFLGKTKHFGKCIYDQLVKIDDSPHKVAAGFGVGVFLGILPGMGPVASVVVSTVLKINKAAALTGSLLTNTWLSVVTFILSIKIGSAIIGTDWQEAYRQIQTLMRHFDWKNLFSVSVLNILKPLMIGYVIVGVVAGVMSYLSILFVFLLRKKIV